MKESYPPCLGGHPPAGTATQVRQDLQDLRAAYAVEGGDGCHPVVLTSPQIPEKITIFQSEL